MTLTIGLSYAPKELTKFSKYSNALNEAAKRLGYELELVDLFEHPLEIESVDGVLFTGGDDVNPTRYGQTDPEHLAIINEARDESEFAAATRADERGLPIFGICRGLQMLNVHYGGTLIHDLETSGLPAHTRIGEVDRRHNVHLETGTFLKRATRQTESNVTSAHHQAIDTAAPGLKISAKSSVDGVPEAIEWDDQTKKPFFLAVQWHPERMNFDEPLAGELFEKFLSEAAMNKIIAGRG